MFDDKVNSMHRQNFSTMIRILLFITLALPFSVATTSSARLLSPPARFLRKQYMAVHGKRMAYVDVGSGDPIVFLHGNPTSSYLWRNVMPEVEGRGRLIAPDLIGMGDSDKLDISGPNVYTYLTHSKFLFQLLQQLGVKERVTLVVHDWGSALGFLWAFQNRKNLNAVKGIAFMESLVAPFKSFENFLGDSADAFKLIRGPAGEELVLKNDLFVGQSIQASVFRNLTQAELDEYQKPFLEPGESRRPLLTWARQVPIGGDPSDVARLFRRYSRWLSTSNIPKLFINGDPGMILIGAQRELVRTWPEVTEVTVRGIHFLQEDSPVEIGQTIAKWLPQ